MKAIRSAMTIAVLALFATAAVQAQSPTREEVKKEAAAANKAGTTVKGEAEGGKPPVKPAPSTTTREERKKEAAAATKSGATVTGAGDSTKGKAAAKPASSAARADVKKEAAAATKSGDTVKGTLPAEPKK